MNNNILRHSGSAALLLLFTFALAIGQESWPTSWGTI